MLNCEPISELSERMSKHKSPDIYVVDSFQYAQMSYKEYIRFKEAHRDKLIIFTYDAALKVWVEGYKAFSKGRFIGSTGEYVVWQEGAERYWGEK